MLKGYSGKGATHKLWETISMGFKMVVIGQTNWLQRPIGYFVPLLVTICYCDSSLAWVLWFDGGFITHLILVIFQHSAF